MTDSAFLESVVIGVKDNVRKRVIAETEPMVRRIIEEEVASVAVQISRYVSVQSFSDRLVIEIRKTGKESA